jgi:hypothetical protein
VEAGRKRDKAKTENEVSQMQRQADTKWRPSVGDTVHVPKLGDSALVTEVKGRKVAVVVGQMTFTLNVSEVLAL